MFGGARAPCHGPREGQQLLTCLTLTTPPADHPTKCRGREQGRECRTRVGRDANAARWLTDRREVLGGVCGPESRFSDDGQTPVPLPKGSLRHTTQTGPLPQRVSAVV